MKVKLLRRARATEGKGEAGLDGSRKEKMADDRTEEGKHFLIPLFALPTEMGGHQV